MRMMMNKPKKFKSEIDIISNLKHENIVAFYELDEDDEKFLCCYGISRWW